MSKADLLRIPGRRTHEQYKKEYSESELNEVKSDFVETSAELDKLEEKKKGFMDVWKEETKPLKAEVKRLLPICHKGYEWVSAEVENVVNDDEGTVEFIDIDTGEKVGYRKQVASERIVLFNKVEE
jgi:hypothetical protein